MYANAIYNDVSGLYAMIQGVCNVNKFPIISSSYLYVPSQVADTKSFGEQTLAEIVLAPKDVDALAKLFDPVSKGSYKGTLIFSAGNGDVIVDSDGLVSDDRFS